MRIGRLGEEIRGGNGKTLGVKKESRMNRPKCQAENKEDADSYREFGTRIEVACPKVRKGIPNRTAIAD
jgi:hypothetical protein